MPSVLIFGATGFVGVPLVKELKKTHSEWPITAYVRPTRSIEAVKEELGVERVERGEFSDFDKIKALSKEHDIVINAGNSFTNEPVAAVCAGLKERSADAKGKVIHISGGGNFIDFGTSGQFNPDSKIWSDANEDDIKAIDTKMFNGQSDTTVLDAGKDGSIETYIVCIGVAYGGAAVGSKNMGVGYSIMTGNANSMGYVPYVGDGSAVVTTTHVVDAVSFLMKIIETAAQGPAEGSVYSRWYNVQTERVKWKDLATELARIMFEKGIFTSKEPKSVAVDEAGKGEAKYLIAANMLMDGSRAAKMGYKSMQPSILTQIHDDLKHMKLEQGTDR